MRILLVAGFVLGMLAAPIAASHFANPSSVSGGVPLSASSSGPTLVIDGATDADLEDPFPDAETVNLSTADGNVTVTSTADTSVTIHRTNITGTWTNATNIDTANGDVTIDPEDKEAVTVGNDIDHVAFRSQSEVAPDDGTPDFTYGGSTGQSKVVVGGLPADTSVVAVDANTGAALDGGTTDANGQVAFSDLDNSDHVVELEEGTGSPSLTNPRPEGPQNDFPTELKIDVDDEDFPNEEVNVTFKLDGTEVGTDTLTDTGTASTTISTPSPGEHTVRAEAEDSTGKTTNTTWTFSSPDNLTIREATDPWSDIDDRQVNVTFYQDDQFVVERSTNDGNVSLEGLNVDDQIVAEAEASGFNDSYLVIDDITKQNTLFMLNDSVDSVGVRFILNDQTGTFEGNNATIFVRKPINRTGTLQFKTVFADEFGVAGASVELEDGQRYRLIVKNDQGDSRMLGSYDADRNEVRELTVGAVPADLEERDANFTYDATYLNSSSGRFVRFIFNDTTNTTDSLTMQIHERGNESNVLLGNTTFGGPIGSVGVTEAVPNDENETEWVVKVWVDEGGTVTRLTVPVGPQRPVLDGMPWWLVTLISVGSIWVVAGLFSELNGDVGALVVAGMGGMFWFVDFLPPGLDFGVVILSMLTAGAIFINERRGGSL